MDNNERTETIEGIRRGLESMKADQGKPIEEFFKEFLATYGITEEDEE